MSKLVPEVRIDKNGVPVTKHVNPDKKTGMKDTPAFSPSVDVAARKQLLEDAVLPIARYREDLLGGDFDLEARVRFAKAFMNYSEETLKTLADLGDEELYPNAPSFTYDCIDLLISAGAGEQQIRHALALSAYFHDLDEVQEQGPEMAVAQLLAMTVYDEQIDKYDDALDDRSKYYVLFCEVTMAMQHLLDSDPEVIARYTDDEEIDYDNPHPRLPLGYEQVFESDELVFGTPLIRDTALVNMMIENVDRSDEIIDLITERKEFDAGVLTGYLNDSHPSISGGLI